METQELKLSYEEVSELYCSVTKRINELSCFQNSSLNRKYVFSLQDLQLKLVDVLNSFDNEN